MEETARVGLDPSQTEKMLVARSEIRPSPTKGQARAWQDSAVNEDEELERSLIEAMKKEHEYQGDKEAVKWTPVCDGQVQAHSKKRTRKDHRRESIKV
jgi:hypothetical protein